ncbi:hypothetical protein Ngar_c17530 [Candidatus Nitrososphaera gargensis Ga9.2]|uniref:Uncharacterized protein n=1 Tax=Nitrososphaera gargensis (strain Ga9.2) TaxID=1237085 RepID=K0IBQ8_NITGG|nr:hypothetical protein Ngar_c17530 [Candidatus Nitrososphaera gargensis Ga9.2]
MPADVKDLLYSAINEIGKEKIRMDIASNMDVCEKYCVEILGKCQSRLGPETNDETLATLCEALLHFMLTASLLPSERKINVHGVDLDIVIPSTRMLDKSPDKSLVIQVVRGSDPTAKVKQAESVQQRHENIWLISAKQLLHTRYRNYHLGSGGLPYSQIISDISVFLSEKGARGLKLLHGQ